MPDPQIPPHLAIAKDVTAAEFAKAHGDNKKVWGLTMFGALVPAFAAVLFLNTPFIPAIILGVSCGVGFYFWMSSVFPEAAKSRTMRLQKYPELKKWRQTFGINEPTK